MEKTCEYDICTGCGICSTVCPKKCISFRTGDFGHIYPHIDTEACIDCNRCRQVCPSINDNERHYPEVAYAAFMKNEEEYRSSTSGGAAQALSLNTLRTGGVVYGCATLPGCKVEHIRVDNEEQLKLLKGSKYVQSHAWPCYNQLKTDVKSGKPVLFIGTPCQCAAVKLLYKRQPENLTLVELVCHGVPSQKFLTECLEKKHISISEIDRLWFRTKAGFQIIAATKENDGYRTIYESIPLYQPKCDDIYYKTFFFGYSYRPSCYKCNFARPERVSDITIGDFWGLGAQKSADEIPPHPNGISVILPCTEKGSRILTEISDLINLYPREVEEAIQGNNQLQHPTNKGFNVYLFNLLRKITGVKYAFDISFFIRRGVRYVKRKLNGNRK